MKGIETIFAASLALSACGDGGGVAGEGSSYKDHPDYVATVIKDNLPNSCRVFWGEKQSIVSASGQISGVVNDRLAACAIDLERDLFNHGSDYRQDFPGHFDGAVYPVPDAREMSSFDNGRCYVELGYYKGGGDNEFETVCVLPGTQGEFEGSRIRSGAADDVCTVLDRFAVHNCVVDGINRLRDDGADLPPVLDMYVPDPDAPDVCRDNPEECI